MRALTVVCLILVPIALLARTRPSAQPAPAAPNLDPLVTEGVVQAPVAELWRVFSTADGYTTLGVDKAAADFGSIAARCGQRARSSPSW